LLILIVPPDVRIGAGRLLAAYSASWERLIIDDIVAVEDGSDQ